MEDIINFFMRSKLSITYDHDHWYKVAYGLANTFPYKQAKDFYMRLCRLDGPDHEEYKSDKNFDYCRDNKQPDLISFGTIIYFAQEKGFKFNETADF